MMKRFAFLLLGITLLLVGCSSISSGYITSKKYTPGWDNLVQYCMYYKSNGSCGMYGWRTDHYPERFTFDIAQGDKTGWVDVPESEYSKYKVGDYYGDK